MTSCKEITVSTEGMISKELEFGCYILYYRNSINTPYKCYNDFQYFVYICFEFDVAPDL